MQEKNRDFFFHGVQFENAVALMQTCFEIRRGWNKGLVQFVTGRTFGQSTAGGDCLWSCLWVEQVPGSMSR